LTVGVPDPGGGKGTVGGKEKKGSAQDRMKSSTTHPKKARSLKKTLKTKGWQASKAGDAGQLSQENQNGNL